MIDDRMMPPAHDTASNPDAAPRELAPQRPFTSVLDHWMPLVLLVLTFVVYLPALRAGFIWDDDHYVTLNPVLRDLNGLRRIWFEIGATPQYYPLVFTSFWLERRLWGLNPLGYHAVNVTLHAANSVLLWLLLRRLRVPGSSLAAAIFAIHPVHVESVAWITERKNVLSGFFYLAALRTYLKYRPVDIEADYGVNAPMRDPGSRIPHSYLLSLLLYLCALLCKTVTCSLPATILLLGYWKRCRIARRDVVPLIPMFALGASLSLLTGWLERFNVGAEGSDWDQTLVERCLIAGRAVWFYLGKLLWPHPLVFIYPRWDIDAGIWWQWLFPLTALALVAALFAVRHRAGRGPLVAALFFGGTLVPALGFVNVYPMRFSFVADHFQYLASPGPIVVIAATIARSRWSIVPALACGVIVALGALAFSQARLYVDEEILWRHTLRLNPTAWMAHGNLGKLLVEKGRIDEGLEHCRVVVKVRPDLASSHCNLGGALITAGRFEEAIKHLRDALDIKPRHLRSLHDLAYALLQAGHAQEAVRYALQAVEIEPNASRLRRLLGDIYVRLGQDREAAVEYEAALARFADAPDLHYRVGTIYARLGQNSRAIEHFQAALRLRPDYPEALTNLAVALSAEGRADQAIVCLHRAVTLRPESANARFNLACLLAERGRHAQAAEHFREFLRMNPGDADARQRLREAEQAAQRAGD